MAKPVELYGFPYVERPEAVTMFLEEIAGEGTVCAVTEVGWHEIASMVHAKVRFVDSESANTIVSLARQNRLRYRGCYLTARESAPLTLHFGCRVSEDKFRALWRRENVCVESGEGTKKVFFFFSYESKEYKLELSFDNISRIELRYMYDRPMNFLLFQLLGAPRIFCRQVPDRHWIRDVDFTPSSCIGQSSALCLQIPIDSDIPYLRDDFFCYKESEGRFSLEEGYPFPPALGLVPMVLPPQGIDLPYKILFKVNSLVQYGYLSGQALDDRFFRLLDPKRIELRYIEDALEKLSHLRHCCYDPLRWLITQYTKYRKSMMVPENPAISLHDRQLVYVHRVQITPTKMYFCGPEISLSNRVLRNYPGEIDNFLRVSFVDEDLDRLRSSDLSMGSGKGQTRVYYRILSILRNGITIGDKRFEFLGFSSSQLRESSAWMFASSDKLCATDIREWMGEFHQIRNVAKYAARLGQSFGSSRETLRVDVHEVDLIPDIYDDATMSENKYCFSDGIGKISKDLADKVATKCGLTKFTPSAFQIRYGGYKGVVAVDPTSSMKLSLRKSMSKYPSKNRKLDVLAWSKYQPCFLNRQLIMLLSTLGVKDHVFIAKQKEAVSRLDAILTDPIRAQDELEVMFPGEITNILKEMLVCGYKPDEEPFLSMMLQTLHASKLLEIRKKTRIYVQHGRAMMGCLDETGTLEYGQVFVQCSRHQRNRSSSNKLIIAGKVVVAKNPCLHPGDLRVLTAVDVPALHHMIDCVVFPQKGTRPHPNECSGSDLDGDIYFVCWDCNLVPLQQVEAMDYTPAPTTELAHDVTMEEVEEYFADYILDDNLGIISSAHTVFADRQPKMAKSKACIKLAKLFSTAVDFPKTGVAAKVPPSLRAREYPDFMEKLDKPTYKSKHVIGKLFRQAKAVEDGSRAIEPFTRERAAECYDPDMEVAGFEGYVDDALWRKSMYDRKLWSLMDHYEIGTEAELLGGNVLKKTRRFDKRRDAESANYAVGSLMREARSWFESGGTDRGGYAKKASAWYHVTYHPRYWGFSDEAGEHFLSFAWCVSDRLVVIKRGEPFAGNSSEGQFYGGGFDLAGEV